MEASSSSSSCENDGQACQVKKIHHAAAAESAVLVKTKDDLSREYCREKVQGYDFNRGLDYELIFRSFYTTGFQATNLGLAIGEINKMLDAKFFANNAADQQQGDQKMSDGDDDQLLSYFEYALPFLERRRKTGCTIFLGYTSNLVSSGLRDIFRFLVQHNLVDCLVTSAGGVEEDFVKCLAPTYLGDFNLAGDRLRRAGINRIGNLLVPNDNYCRFEDWILPIFDQMLAEQIEGKIQWTPSKLIARLGEKVNDETSIYYWARRNKIPVFCPGLTDGSLGDMLYFHKYRSPPGLSLDIVEDIKHLNDTAVHSRKTGMIILGGGLPKHHICNANLMRNGADFTVYVNTGQEFDGSDSGAQPDEAVSWGKIRMDSKPVKVCCDATIAFPLLVAETFAKRHHNQATVQ